MRALFENFKPVIRLFQPRGRQISIDREWGHVEYRNLAGGELASFVREIQDAARSLDRLRWVEVNPYLRRVIFSFPPDSYDAEQLTNIVEQAERATRIDTLPFPDDEHHPGDDEALLQLAVELGADLFGLSLGMALSALPLAPLRSAVTATPVLAVMRDLPRFRRWIEERLGRERAELVINLSLSLTQALAQRPVNSLVDLTHKTAQLREMRGRRSAWKEREGELCAAPSLPVEKLPTIPRRPVPIPKGPIEEYADRAWLISLGGFGISILTTGSMKRAAAALFGALPKPARLGREIFSSELGYYLSRRHIVVIDPDRLRLLDRIDCLVIQGDMVSSHKFTLGELTTNPEFDTAQCLSVVEALFQEDNPLAPQKRGEWSLGPLQVLEPEISESLDRELNALVARGEIVVALTKNDIVAALVEVSVVPQTGVEELISAAHEAEMRVVVAEADESALEGLHAEDVISPREGLKNGIRRLQREGRVVCLVASGDSPGLPIADVGIGLCRLGEPPPWGAHLICRSNLSDVRFILQACITARYVSKQSVNIALGTATMGAVVSAGGLVPMTTQRAILLVNAASLVSMLNGARSSAKLRTQELPPPRDPTPWHALEPHGTLVRLETTEQGLTKRQVARRKEPVLGTPTAASELIEAITDELFNPFAPLLAAGAGLSALVGSTADAGVVSGVVALNAIVGGIQRFRTERAIRHLAKESKRKALARRGGKIVEVPADKLVSGDIVLLSPGDVVPADCRIIESQSLEVDASSLTGESLPVAKSASPSFESQIADRNSMLYQGTSIAAGRATAAVVATGDRTEAQRGAFAAKGDRAQGGVEKRLKTLMGLTGPVALISGIGVIGGGLLRGRRLEDLIGSGVSLAVASVPEGLPLLATAAQLAAAERLSRRGVLVRNVRSIEALGRVDVICLDKTGTVTEGRIKLRYISDGNENQELEDLDDSGRRILSAALRATAEGQEPAVRADPTDEALIQGARSIPVSPTFDCVGWERVTELPFEAGRSYHAVVASTPFGSLLGVKGAPEAILPHCERWRYRGEDKDLDDSSRAELSTTATELGHAGLRVLAVAECVADPEEELDPTSLSNLTFHGFLAFSDPVRPSATEAIRRLRKAGVDVLMLTGDHPSTATAIAAELQLDENPRVLTGADMVKLTNDELEDALEGVCVLARATPSQKVRVVRVLQRMGRVVAMCGDGANDAPAIRIANVGVAVGERSTSAARGAADVVLTDERVETLVDAIVEGRAMWASVRSAVSILVGGNLGEIGFTLGAGLIDGRPPLNPRQLLLVNLLTDAAPSMAIALRPPSKTTLASLAQEGPEASLGRPLNREIASRAVVTTIGAGSAWSLGRLVSTREKATTMGLVGVVCTQLGQTIVSGGANFPVLLTGIGSTAALLAMIQTPGVSRFFGCTPLGPLAWTTALGSSAATTYLSVAVPRAFERLTERIQQGLTHTPLVDETALELKG